MSNILGISYRSGFLTVSYVACRYCRSRAPKRLREEEKDDEAGARCAEGSKGCVSVVPEVQIMRLDYLVCGQVQAERGQE